MAVITRRAVHTARRYARIRAATRVSVVIELFENKHDVHTTHAGRLITFSVRRSRGEMYIVHGRLCVSVCVSVRLSLAAFPVPHYCTDPNATWGNGRGCPLVVHYRSDLQSVHGFRCYDNIASNAKCQRVLVLAI